MQKTYKAVELTGWRAWFFQVSFWLTGFTVGLVCGAVLARL